MRFQRQQDLFKGLGYEPLGHTLVKNTAIFCPSPVKRSETELKVMDYITWQETSEELSSQTGYSPLLIYVYSKKRQRDKKTMNSSRGAV